MHRNGLRSGVCLAVALAVIGTLLNLQAYSQTVGGTILGTITDPSGAVIPGVQVSIKNVATGVVRTVTTNDTGFYSARNLLPGAYEVTASLPGFATAVQGDVNLTVGSERSVNIKMKVGEVAERVEVSGEAPALDLSSSILSHVVEGGAIRDLPLNGRDWTQLATLQPGVTTTAGGGAQTGTGGRISVSGGRPTENNYRLNGVSISDHANSGPGSALGVNLGVDAIREFSVLTSTFSAEYGRSSGGVVNAVTRSGTNDFHGSASYFHRNSAMDTRDFFDINPKSPPFRRHQFGGTVGGPIRPNQTFFFVAYESLREALARTARSTVLTAAGRSGQLNTGTVTVSPTMVPFINLFPLPNVAIPGRTDVGEYVWAPLRVSNESFITTRIDHRFSDKDSLNGIYSFDDGGIDDPDTFFQKFNSRASQQQTLSIEEVHVFSPQVMNSARLGFARSVNGENLTTTILDNRLEDTALGFIPGKAIGQLQVTGLTSHPGGLGAPEANNFHFNSYQGYNDLYITRGKYSLKMGANVERLQDNADLPFVPNGRMIFNSVSDFLRNQPFQLQAPLAGSDTVRGVRQTIFGAYVQADVRYRPNLTFNLGLRYEMVTVPTEHHNRLAVLRNLGDVEPTVGRFFENPTLLNFAPRAGYAWDPFGTGKTSVRGGIGMFDVLPLSYLFRTRFPRTPPFFKTGFANLVPGDFPKGGFAKLGPQSFRTVFIEPAPPRAYKIQWNMNIQRDLGGGLTATVGYVGARGVHLPKASDDIDIVIPTLTSSGYVWPSGPARANSRRFNENFGRISGMFWNVDSFYHALQTALKKEMSHGLMAQASYTFGKTIDLGSNTFSDDEYPPTIANPYPFDMSLQRGRADYDVRHTLVVNFLWEIGVPASWAAPARWALGGWQFGGIFRARSGPPFNVILQADRAGSKSSQTGNYLGQRPNFVAGPGCEDVTRELPANLNTYINLDCFSFPAEGTLGNFGRNVLEGPGAATLDFSLFKNHRIGEDINIQFRAEMFNALNHTNFVASGRPTIFDGNGNRVTTAARITSAERSRLVQLGLRIVF